MKQQKFNYESFFNSMEREQEQKKIKGFKQMVKTEKIDFSDYEYIKGGLCFII